MEIRGQSQSPAKRRTCLDCKPSKKKPARGRSVQRTRLRETPSFSRGESSLRLSPGILCNIWEKSTMGPQRIRDDLALRKAGRRHGKEKESIAPCFTGR